MKNIYTAITFILCSAMGFAQENNGEDGASIFNGRHELRLDAVELIAVANFEVDYEYVINQFSGAGIAVSFDVGGKDDEDDLVWAVTPFYRQYIFNRKGFAARGLFAEGSGSVGQYRDYSGFYDFENDRYIDSDEKDVRVGAALAIGYKFVSRSKFLLEFSAGVGRFFGDSKGYDDIYFRGGLLVGYRF